jgi:putative ABC transport system permease protein
LVLAIGLANTGTLLVVRAARTRYDIAVRAALGASRRNLIANSLLDALVIAGAATVISWLLSAWLDEAVRRVLFPGMVVRSGVNTTAIATAAGAGALGFIVAALVFIWHLPAQVQVIDLAGHAPGGNRRTRTMTGLLLIQTAASVLLLAGAAMFGGSLYKLWAQDFGMDMDSVLIADFEQGPERIDGHDEMFYRALAQVRQMPGVEMATTFSAIPFSGFHVPPIAVPGRAEPPAVGRQLPFLIAATPEFLKILGIQLVEGRLLSDADDRGAPVVIVNQAMARGVWPGESAVGRCIRVGFDPDFNPATATGPATPSDRVPCREIVGVVRDLRQRSVLPLDNEDRLMQYFVPPSQVPFPPFMVEQPQRVRGLMMRVSTDASVLAPIVRRAVVGDRVDLPFIRVRPYSELLERQMRPWSMGTTLLGLFSALALAVAAVGLYAAFAHAVAERRREMAIRIAVGAEPSAVLRMVLRDALVLTATGAALGCAAAVGSGRWIQSLLYGIEATDPRVLGAAAAAMLIVALAATIRPARTASKADPSQLLRTC